MGKKKRNADKDQKIHAVFSVKPNKGTNTAMLKCVGHVKVGSDISDEPLICNILKDSTTDSDGNGNGNGNSNGNSNSNGNNDKYVYKITDAIYANFFHCNIRDSYVMTSKILPVIYASILYQTSLVCGHLFNIFIDFVIETEIKSEKELVNNALNGKYQLRIKIDDNDKPKIIDLDCFDGTEFVIEMMKNLIETDEMKSIISKLMEERKKERVEKLGSLDDIDVPKPKYNFTDLVKQYKNSGKLNL